MTDEQFFQTHHDRHARIRMPVGKITVVTRPRGTRVIWESEAAFRQLGPHDRDRRRILVWRTPRDHPTHPNTIVLIPFLLYADETVEDRDDVLLPIIHEVMTEQRGKR